MFSKLLLLEITQTNKMSQGKCALLKPVDNLTGTFLLFSQYTQDLTQQYSNPDSYRCVPSKYIALNLDYAAMLRGIDPEASIEDKNTVLSAHLGEVFENYFENACTYMRAKYHDTPSGFNPEWTRTLLFQTLQKYQLMHKKELVSDESAVINSSSSDTHGAVYAISEEIQYIGDINIYSFGDKVDGIGYNEIYCYIPNEAKATDYFLSAVPFMQAHTYDNDYILGYENQESYNGLSWLVTNPDENALQYIDKDDLVKYYGIGKYKELPGEEASTTDIYTLTPECLEGNADSDDKPRKVDGKILDKFKVNAIVVLYDIVQIGDLGNQIILHKNVPLGIYFAGKPEVDENDVITMSNEITKYVDSDQIYNQGTSYGLRVCTRFLSNPFSTEIVETTVKGSSNVSEMAPVLEKMGETLMAVEDILDDKDKLYQMLKDHLSQFKNNKVNVPYVRQLGNKKYWFVNGKNTGAIAQYEYASADDIIARAIELIMENVYSKEDINYILSQYVSRTEFETKLAEYAKKEYVDAEIARLREELRVWLQGVEEA